MFGIRESIFELRKPTRYSDLSYALWKRVLEQIIEDTLKAFDIQAL